MRGIYIVFSTKSIETLLVWPFVWFVVAFGFGAVPTSAETEARARRLGFISSYARDGDSRAAHAWYLHYFLNQKSVADVFVCSAVCLVRWLVVVLASGSGAVLTLAEKEVPGIHHNICKRRGLSEQHMRGI